MTELDPTVFGKFKDALNTVIEQSKDVIPTEHPATVMAKDEDGTVWVRLFGSDTDTPVSSTTSTVDVGDNVEVVISEGRAKILRNRSTPAAGVSFVARAFGQAVEDAEAYSSRQFADAARMNSITKKLAEEADAIATAINQHFFDDDQGIHVTDVTQDEWEASYPDFSDQSTTKPYNNILVNSAGILLRSALKYLVSISRSGIVFYDGTGNAASNQTASFGIDGAIVGKTNSNYITTTSNGIDFFSGNRKMLSFVSKLQDATTYISDIFSKNTYSEADIAINTWDNSASVGSYAKLWGVGGSSSATAVTCLDSSYWADEYGTPSKVAHVYTLASKNSTSEVGASVKNSSDSETSWRMYSGGFQMYNLLVFACDAHLFEFGKTDESDISFNASHSSTSSKTFMEIHKATNMDGDAIVLGAGGLTVIGAGEAAQNYYNAVVPSTYSPGSEQLLLGSDNSIYFAAGCQTIANRKTMEFNSSGNLWVPNSVIASDGHVYINSPALTDGTAPDSETAGHYLAFRDSSSKFLGAISPRFGTSSQNWQAIRFYAQRNVSGTNKYNIFDLRLDSSGNPSVYMSAPKAWNSALQVYYAASSATQVNVANTSLFRFLVILFRTNSTTYSGSAKTSPVNSTTVYIGNASSGNVYASLMGAHQVSTTMMQIRIGIATIACSASAGKVTLDSRMYCNIDSSSQAVASNNDMALVGVIGVY